MKAQINQIETLPIPEWSGQSLVSGGIREEVVFNDLSEDELEMARLLSRVDFFALVRTALNMIELGLSFKAAYTMHLMAVKKSKHERN